MCVAIVSLVLLSILSIINAQTPTPAVCSQQVSFDPIQGQAIPQPTFTTSFNNSFFFEVNSTYLANGYTWVIDFTPWSYNLTSPTNCENRLSSTFAGLNSSQYFNSAPDASQPNSLNTVTYPAYGPSSWSLSALSCGSIQYERSFGFADLQGCSNQGNTQRSINISYLTNGTDTYLVYSGSVYASAVKAVQPNVYSVTTFQFPFTYRFNSFLNGIISYNGDASFVAALISNTITPSGQLQIVLATYLSSSPGTRSNFANPIMVSSPVSADITGTIPSGICTNLDGSGRCQQSFTITSSGVSSSYSGAYAFSFTVTSCNITSGACTNTGTVYSGSVTIQQQANTIVDGTGSTTAFTTTSTIYNSAFTSPANSTVVYRVNDVIAVKDALQVSTADADALNLQISNAWVCISTTSQPVVYDPTNGLYGCSAPSAGNGVTAGSLVQIIRNGAAAASTATESSFAAALLASKSIAALPYYSTVGFNFKVQRLVDYSTTYYIHVESQVTARTTARSAKSAKAFSVQSSTSVRVSSFSVQVDRNALILTNTPTSSGTNIMHSRWALLLVALVTYLIL